MNTELDKFYGLIDEIENCNDVANWPSRHAPAFLEVNNPKPVVLSNWRRAG